MIRRLVAAAAFLLMLNVMALGDGLFSIESKLDCAGAMANGHAQHEAPAKERCNLPWSPGCAAAAPCLPNALAVARTTASVASSERVSPVAPVLSAPAPVEVGPDHPPPRI